MRLRVLLANDRLGYADARLHGAGRLMLDWTRVLRARGHALSPVILRAGGPLGEQALADGLPFVFLDRHPFDPRAALDLARLVRERDIQLLHLQGYGASTLGRLVGRRLGVPTLVHVHADYRVEPKGHPWYMRAIDRALAPGTARAIAISRAVAEFAVEQQGFAPEQVSILHNPIDLEHFGPPTPEQRDAARRSFDLPPDLPVAICVARFDPVKGVDLLLDAVSRELDHGPAFALLLVGDGPERPRLERQGARLRHPERIRWLGYQQDVRRALWAADLAVVPSRSEGLGLAALEAMATGLPVVATAVGGLPEIVSEESGALVEPGNPAALGRALGRLLHAEPERSRRVAGALHVASLHGLETFARELETLYARALESAAGT
jgi:glycosyltransferase involved in cell wall biosynthesis